jgi:hypothetical protein
VPVNNKIRAQSPAFHTLIPLENSKAILGLDDRVKGNQAYIGKRLAVTLDEGLDPKTRAYFEEVIAEAGEALESGEALYTIKLYDRDEPRRFERTAEKLKKELRGKR